MTKTKLEIEVADLRRRLVDLEERVRIDADAQAFLQGDHRVREGDHCVIDGFPTRVSSISSGGKWTYFNGRNSVEPFRVPPSDDIQRLYTVAEVAEIVAKAPLDLSREDVADLVEALDVAAYSRNRGEESRWKALRERLAQACEKRDEGAAMNPLHARKTNDMTLTEIERELSDLEGIPIDQRTPNMSDRINHLSYARNKVRYGRVW